MKTLAITTGLVASLALPAAARQQMTVRDYEPRSALVVPGHPVTRAKFPFVDVHSHHGRAASTREARSKVSINGLCPAAIRAGASPAGAYRFLQRKFAPTGLKANAMSRAEC